jgi:UDP-N-acetylglucosamine 2-epimerase (non-hydrolysing)/GDP/UDP-N,N'-diacetylbacillosamine 2-epimerase (hydrolysing)
VAVTYHPATLVDEPPAATFLTLVAGIRDAAPTASIIVTAANADDGGSDIDVAAAQVASVDARFTVVASLGPSLYWSLLHHADVVAGNSSSALIEAPIVGVPVVDIGARQASRLRAPSCLHATPQRAAISAAVTEALSRPRRPEPSPYGDGAAVPRILDRLAAITSPQDLLTPTPLLAADARRLA